MTLSDRSDTDRLHLVFEDGEHFMGTMKELREKIGADGDQVLGTSDAARIWPAYSEASWRKWASEDAIPGAWQDAPGGPWRLPYLSCKSFVSDLQRRAIRRGRRGPKGPWAARQATGGVPEGAVLRGGSAEVERGSADDEEPGAFQVA